jgi:PKD repeat protein
MDTTTRCSFGQVSFSYSVDSPRTVHLAALPNDTGLTYKWSLGDGDTTFGRVITHTYLSYGNYYVTVYVSNGHCTDMATQVISLSAPPPPPTCNASFNSSVNGNYVTVFPLDSLSASMSTWYFGDGSAPVNAQVATHLYAHPGTYTVRHVVSDSAIHCKDSTSSLVTIVAPSCSVTITAQQDTGKTYTFSASPTNNGADSSFTYQWTIDSIMVSNARSFVYTFSRTGIHQVCVFQHSADSTCNVEQCESVFVPGDTTVTPPSCNAGFTYNTIGDSVQFYAGDTTAGTVNTWYFGDGSATSAAPSPFHIYAPGTYSVIHLVSDSATHCFDSTSQSITVGRPPCSVIIGTQLDTGLTYTLTATAQNAGNDSAFTYQWLINDSLVSTAQSFVYTFPRPGSYQVCVFQNSPDSSCHVENCQSLYVFGDTTHTPPPPVDTCSVTFTYTSDSLQPATVHFHAVSVPFSDSTTYTWTISADSNFATPLAAPFILTGSDLVYTFPDTGKYFVQLRASTPECTAYTAQVITISRPKSNHIKAYPNPVRDVVHVNLTLPAAETIRVTIFNAEGIPVDAYETGGVRGLNILSIPVKNLMRGIYFMHLQYGTTSSESRFQKL